MHSVHRSPSIIIFPAIALQLFHVLLSCYSVFATLLNCSISTKTPIARKSRQTQLIHRSLFRRQDLARKTRFVVIK